MPTPEEMLRVKAFLVLERNQARDDLDVVALPDRIDLEAAAHVLSKIDDYYGDGFDECGSVLTGVVLALSDLVPTDSAVIKELSTYCGIDAHWQDWRTVVSAGTERAALLACDA